MIDVPAHVDALTTLLNKMDLPIGRKDASRPDNIRWLMRNIGVRNSAHADFLHARNLLVQRARELNFVSNKEMKETS